jgi:hypothetical protein
MAPEAGTPALSRRTSMPSYCAAGCDVAGRFRCRSMASAISRVPNAFAADGVGHCAAVHLLGSRPSRLAASFAWTAGIAVQGAGAQDVVSPRSPRGAAAPRSETAAAEVSERAGRTTWRPAPMSSGYAAGAICVRLTKRLLRRTRPAPAFGPGVRLPWRPGSGRGTVDRGRGMSDG